MASKAARLAHRQGDRCPYRFAARWIFNFSIVLSLLLAACSGAGASQVRFIDANDWEAQFSLPYDSQTGLVRLDETDQPTLDELKTAVRAALDPMGIETVWAEQIDRVEILLTGDGGPAQVGRMIYGDLAPLFRPYAPGTTIILSGAVQAGEELVITLESSLTSGYSWQVTHSQGVRLLAAGDYHLVADRAGAPVHQSIHFEGESTGQASLTLVYRRPWELPPAAARVLTLQAPVLNQLSTLTNPDDGAVQAEMSAEPELKYLPSLSPFANQIVPTNLPAVFDWRAQGKVPAVRNQGSCGSCWAFATVGVLESAILIKDGLTSINLSEQFLVSCNQEDWGCAGGATAHDYHWWKAGANQNTIGAVYESDYPYTGTDSTCKIVSDHPYQISDWGYIPNTDPIDDLAIKQAIYQYGPVKASVCVGPAFQRYHGGVFATDESQVCGGWTNHAIILVGWDDTRGENGVWILRNSWGAVWGDKGYMFVDRSVSNVGMNASYVIYNGGKTAGLELPVAFLPMIER